MPALVPLLVVLSLVLVLVVALVLALVPVHTNCKVSLLSLAKD